MKEKDAVPSKSLSKEDAPDAGSGQRPSSTERQIDMLLARRVDDLARLATMTRSRDVLETRTALILDDLSKAKEQLKTKERLLEKLEKRSGSGRFKRAESREGSDQDKRLSFLDQLWFRRTIRLARTAHKQGRLVDSQVLFDSALTLQDTPSLWTELGHVLREQDLFDGAQRAYEQALAKEPNNAENLFLAGYCAEKAGRNNVAAKFYDQAMHADPKLVDRYDHLRDFNARLFD